MIEYCYRSAFLDKVVMTSFDLSQFPASRFDERDQFAEANVRLPLPQSLNSTPKVHIRV